MASPTQKLLLVAASLLLTLSLSSATTFTVTNNCSYPIWPAAVPGGGSFLLSGQNWTFTVDSAENATSGRIWGRTNCSFDLQGNGSCLTGNCQNRLICTENGSPPATLVRYYLYQYGNNDFYHVSLLDGFNIPIAVVPITAENCSSVRCAVDVNRLCPPRLRTRGGCNSACNVFHTDQYCCNKAGNCTATAYSNYFKKLCPDAYCYPQDDPTSTYTCPSGGNFTVVFCPSA
ncbi:hypothetical protein HPP92_018664 [Vanilla planifolia]|uniref:Thaumatin-like protein n=1 Tax=Vanilla planifolia TaxID=51239 RepID=A0A835QCG5_VANPL|nr:hypothetical protein HPP92_018664 [Vanilla planifolia]